jgi:serine/threonine-protein kinase
MGSVWLARLEGKHGFEKLVAIKTILPSFAADPDLRTMFLDEALIASGILHANVAQTLDLGDHEGTLYAVMEWIDGDSVRTLHREVERARGRIPVGVALRIAADVCAGLHAAHELRSADGARLGVVHRDVSPHNILLDASGVAKIIDFGIAKARDRVSANTSSDQIKGKIEYMAPEQAVGGPVDHRADLFGVGATLYHLIAGSAPFAGANAVETFQRLVSGGPPPGLPPRVSPPVCALVERALAHRPSDRFETADGMLRAIESAARGDAPACTHADVAEFAARYLEGCAAVRRRLVERARRAAAERTRAVHVRAHPARPASTPPEAAACGDGSAHEPEPAPRLPPGTDSGGTRADPRPHRGSRVELSSTPEGAPTGIASMSLEAARSARSRDQRRSRVTVVAMATLALVGFFGAVAFGLSGRTGGGHSAGPSVGGEALESRSVASGAARGQAPVAQEPVVASARPLPSDGDAGDPRDAKVAPAGKARLGRSRPGGKPATETRVDDDGF